MQAREDGPHAAPVSRGNPMLEAEVPPGVLMHYGNPTTASPFVQLKLPNGMTFERKKSRSVSFVGDNGMVYKGTTRSKKNAIECVSAWAWQWWESLSDLQKSSIRALANKRSHSDDESVDGSRKKPRNPRCRSENGPYGWLCIAQKHALKSKIYHFNRELRSYFSVLNIHALKQGYQSIEKLFVTFGPSRPNLFELSWP